MKRSMLCLFFSCFAAAPSLRAETAGKATGVLLPFYAKLPQVPGRNKVFAPLSLFMTLEMLRDGCEPESQAEIDRFLAANGLNQSEWADDLSIRRLLNLQPPKPQANAHRDELFGDLDESDSGGHVDFHTANALFVDQKTTLTEWYPRLLKRRYDAAVASLDFNLPNATKHMNAWANTATNGLIPRFINQVAPQTRLILANAAYFFGRWAVAFDEMKTEGRPFHRENGSAVRVPMMHQEGEFRFASTPKLEAVELPFIDPAFRAVVFLPAQGVKLADFEAEMAAGAFAETLKKLAAGSPRLGELFLPRFAVAGRQDLKKLLTDAGVHRVFDERSDPFAPLAPHRGLFLSDAVQAVEIKVAEDGAEAAATTHLSDSLGDDQRLEPEFHLLVDRPFVLAIVHASTALPLFITSVASPVGGQEVKSAGNDKPASPGKTPGLAVRGEGLTPEEVSAVRHANLKQIQTCYDEALKVAKPYTGKVVVAYHLAANGRVASVKTKPKMQPSNKQADAKLAQCVEKTIAAWRFPKLRGGGSMTVGDSFRLEYPQIVR